MNWNGAPVAGVTQIAESIQAEIVRGRLRTGHEIVLAELSEELDVAMNDVRQALLRLVEQNLVRESDTGAFHVVSTSSQDLRELTAMRQLLEGEAVRLSALRRSAASDERLRATYRELESAGAGTSDTGLAMRWREAHAAFHDALCAECGNVRLLASVRSLRDEAEIYRELSAAAMTETRRTAVEQEHRELLALALAGRAVETAAAVRSHLDGTMRSVVDMTAEDGAR